MHKSEEAAAGGADGRARALRCVAGIAMAVLLGACGGGGPAPSGRDAATPEALPTSIVKTIDTGTMPPNAGLFVAGSANGDGIVMWLTDTGSQRQLWAVRYRSLTGQWSEPLRISRNNVSNYSINLTADATGNAMAVWSEEEDGIVAARFSAAAGTWAAPVALGPNVGFAQVAGNDAGVVHVIGAAGGDHVFDPAAGVWRSSGRFLQTNVSVGAATPEALALDQAGHAIGLYRYAWDVDLLGSNHFSPATGQWQPLPADGELIGVLPGSQVTQQYIVNANVAALGQGDFIGAWNVDTTGAGGITRVVAARYSGASGTWSSARTVAQVSPDSQLSSFYLRSGGGNTFALWSQTLAGHPAARLLRLDDNGIACDDVHTVDSVLGGAALRPQLVVDARGNALATWQENDGERSRIAYSRFNAPSGRWLPAELLETGPGDVSAAIPAVAGSQVLFAWLRPEGPELHIQATLLPTVQPPP